MSSNPSISEPPPGEGSDKAEDYPRLDWDHDSVADFTINRFNGTWATPEGRHRMRDTTLAPKTKFWVEARTRARELIVDAEPTQDYVMTEVVHCKSKREIGVNRAVARCAERHLDPILASTTAPLVVIVGAAARNRLRRVWSLPTGLGTRAVNGIEVSPNVFMQQIGATSRLVVYLSHFTSMEKVRTFGQFYGSGVFALQEVVAGRISVEEAAVRLSATVLDHRS